MKKSTIAIYNVSVVAVALLSALLVGAILFLIAGGSPIQAYRVMFTEPLKGAFGIDLAQFGEQGVGVHGRRRFSLPPPRAFATSTA